jgi:hypothetical protein
VKPALLVLLGASLCFADRVRQRRQSVLARAAIREKEIAIRVALGAPVEDSPQLLTESAVLGLAGGAGIADGGVGLKVLVALSPGDIPRPIKPGLMGEC